MFKKVLLISAISLALFSCGERVEVPPAHVGKIQTATGMSEGVRMPSKFRMSMCLPFQVCDKLVLLDVSDQVYGANFDTFMPQDELSLKYGVSMTLGVSSSMYDFIYNSVPAVEAKDGSIITQEQIYARYVRPKIDTVLPEIVAEWSIDQIASNRAEVNAFITSRLTEELSDTPFNVKFVGLTNVEYPPIITNAKEDAAERREQEQQMLAQRTLDLLAIQTEKEVEEARREVELQKATTQVLIAEEMLSPAYETLLKYETLKAMAASQNKVFVPTEMLDSIAVQNEASK